MHTESVHGGFHIMIAVSSSPTVRCTDRIFVPSYGFGGTLQNEEYGKPGDAGEYGRPTSPFCSTTNITIGEEHRTTLHCPGGTLR